MRLAAELSPVRLPLRLRARRARVTKVKDGNETVHRYCDYVGLTMATTSLASWRRRRLPRAEAQEPAEGACPTSSASKGQDRRVRRGRRLDKRKQHLMASVAAVLTIRISVVRPQCRRTLGLQRPAAVTRTAPTDADRAPPSGPAEDGPKRKRCRRRGRRRRLRKSSHRVIRPARHRLVKPTTPFGEGAQRRTRAQGRGKRICASSLTAPLRRQTRLRRHHMENRHRSRFSSARVKFIASPHRSSIRSGKLAFGPQTLGEELLLRARAAGTVRAH